MTTKTEQQPSPSTERPGRHSRPPNAPPAMAATLEQIAPGTVTLNLPTGTRVRWTTATPASGTRFGLVVATTATTLIVVEENTTTERVLVPGVDHIEILGRAS